MSFRLFLAVLVFLYSFGLYTYRNEIAFMGCFIVARMTDEPPVRTDGLCALNYLVDSRTY